MDSSESASWSELFDAVAKSLKHRILEMGDKVQTGQEVEFLAESVTDDLVGQFDLKRRSHD